MKLRMMLALAMLPVGLACSSSSDTTAPTASSYIGTYTLVKMNGTALPDTITNNSTLSTVTAGTATISSNGTWSATLTATPSNISVGGTYTYSNGTLTLTNTGDATTNAAVLTSNNTVLTITSGGGDNRTFTFDKN